MRFAEMSFQIEIDAKFNCSGTFQNHLELPKRFHPSTTSTHHRIFLFISFLSLAIIISSMNFQSLAIPLILFLK
jgi:hypothetical protein